MLAVPPISWLRNEHVVPPLGGRPDDTGYLVRIVSAEDDNHISYHNAYTVSPVGETLPPEGHVTVFQNIIAAKNIDYSLRLFGRK